MLSACVQSGILAAGLIACRHNGERVSMMSFSSAEMRAGSTCYYRRAYAPRTQVNDGAHFLLCVYTNSGLIVCLIFISSSYPSCRHHVLFSFVGFQLHKWTDT